MNKFTQPMRHLGNYIMISPQFNHIYSVLCVPTDRPPMSYLTTSEPMV